MADCRGGRRAARAAFLHDMALYSVAPIFRRRFRRRIIRPGALICLPCPTPNAVYRRPSPGCACWRRLPAAAGRLGRRRAVVPVSRRRGGARRGRGGLGRAASLAAGPADRRPSLARRPPLVGGVGAGRRRAAGLVAHAAAVQRPRLGRRGEPHAAGHGAGRPRAPARRAQLRLARRRRLRRSLGHPRLRPEPAARRGHDPVHLGHARHRPPLVSFGFDDGQRVVFSVEIRKERGEQFSELGGFFKQFELSVIAADERDIVRSAHRRARRNGVDLPNPHAARGDARAVLSYVDTANALRAETALLSHGQRQLHHHHLPDGARHRAWPAGRLPPSAVRLPARVPVRTRRPGHQPAAGRDPARCRHHPARGGRATRRRSRKPYANLSCPRP